MAVAEIVVGLLRHLGKLLYFYHLWKITLYQTIPPQGLRCPCLPIIRRIMRIFFPHVPAIKITQSRCQCWVETIEALISPSLLHSPCALLSPCMMHDRKRPTEWWEGTWKGLIVAQQPLPWWRFRCRHCFFSFTDVWLDHWTSTTTAFLTSPWKKRTALRLLLASTTATASTLRLVICLWTIPPSLIPIQPHWLTDSVVVPAAFQWWLKMSKFAWFNYHVLMMKWEQQNILITYRITLSTLSHYQPVHLTLERISIKFKAVGGTCSQSIIRLDLQTDGQTVESLALRQYGQRGSLHAREHEKLNESQRHGWKNREMHPSKLDVHSLPQTSNWVTTGRVWANQKWCHWFWLGGKGGGWGKRRKHRPSIHSWHLLI